MALSFALHLPRPGKPGDILSDGEANLQDVRDRRHTDGGGYQKVEAFAAYVREHLVPIKWLWVDTCCINKESAAELSEAINSMFRWYHNAELCLVYLADVETAKDESRFEKSEWFERGWTLQELLAPRMVLFVTKEWHVIGHKGRPACGEWQPLIGRGLEKKIAWVTGIPERVLHDYGASTEWTVHDKMKWMEGRKTTRPEDMSYALFGILGVTLPVIYGEEYEGARRRLLDVIHQHAKHYREIADWLASPDPWTNHESARQLHQPHTGTWLLESAQYRDWKTASIRHLWMHGKAGCGKTILCSTAIADVKAYCERQPGAAYAVFYFSFSDNKKQRLVDLVCSLVRQLGWKGLALSMLQQAYNKPNQTALGLDELRNILLACFQSYDEVFLLVDALDESPDDSDVRHEMLEFLTWLSQRAHQVKIFATSREMPDIRQSMTRLGAEPTAIAARSVDEDIRRYMATQLSRDHRLSRLDQQTRALIEETISGKADGMFRWAFCQLQELKKLKSTKPRYVKEALRNLPTSLDATYDRILSRIEGLYRKEAIVLLQWLAYAQSPPSLGELREAAIIDVTDEGRVEVDERGGLEDTVEILSGLVVLVGIDTENYESQDEEHVRSPDSEDTDHPAAYRNMHIEGDTKVRLAHFSIKEYLESKRILEKDVKDFHFESTAGHSFLAQSCVTYMLHYSKSDLTLSTPQDLINFPLLRYAAQSWFVHASVQQVDEAAREVVLLGCEELRQNWLLVHCPDEPLRRPFDNLAATGSGLYYASLLGLQAAVGKLLLKGSDVNAQGGHYGNSLQAASWKGHEKVVQMLLDAGAEVNAQGGQYGNALQAASGRGHEKVVQMLLDAGAKVNAQGGVYDNALYAASQGGHDKVVQMLLDAGAEVNAQAKPYGSAQEEDFGSAQEEDSGSAQEEDSGSALYAASSGGHEKVVQVLLDAGAEVNAQGGQYGNALQAASLGGHEKVVQMLLEAGAKAASLGGHEKVVQMLVDAGAEVNAQGGHYGTALYAASVTGHEKVVQVLLAAGAKVNAQGGYYGNALQAASLGGHEKVVQMLLGAGADLNAQGGQYGTALQAASERSREKVVQVLLGAGAEVNAKGGQYGNALQAASERSREKVVQMLLGAGAEVNAQGGGYGNALQAASQRGNEKVVQMLLDAGAEVNAQGVKFGTALYAASVRGSEKMVQVLLDAGAEVNAQGGGYGNALQAASVTGHGKVVQVLLDAGAKVNAQGGYYGTALYAASVTGHVKVVQVLLDTGAKVNAQGGYYGNALQAASVTGHVKVVQVLLDAGAKVNAQGGVYDNALQAASDTGHVKVVQVLLDAGAKVNAQGGVYDNALQAASRERQEKVVQISNVTSLGEVK
ncbi:hypothetical protein LTR22_027516 [Elasticomyces elasticus]|nr:hypothetical protein LTR22_027516 [Elasticomyces elasticus]